MAYESSQQIVTKYVRCLGERNHLSQYSLLHEAIDKPSRKPNLYLKHTPVAWTPHYHQSGNG